MPNLSNTAETSIKPANVTTETTLKVAQRELDDDERHIICPDFQKKNAALMDDDIHDIEDLIQIGKSRKVFRFFNSV